MYNKKESTHGWFDIAKTTGKQYTIGDWVDLIAEYYTDEFLPQSSRKPTILTKDLVTNIFKRYALYGYMTYALAEMGVERSTLWRWRKKSQAIKDMYIVVEAYIKYQKRPIQNSGTGIELSNYGYCNKKEG